MPFVFSQSPVAGTPEEPVTVSLTFDRVDVRAFVKVIQEITGRRFVVDEGVKGQLTVLAPRVPVSGAYELALKILESSGCAVVEEGDFSRVVPMPPRNTPMAPVVGEGRLVPAMGLVTRVIRLRNASVADLRKVLDALAGREKGGGVTAVEATNHLILTDTADNIRRFEQIIAELDRPGAGTASEVYVLKYANAVDFVQQYSRVTTGKAGMVREGVPVKSGVPLTLFAAPHANSIVLVGPAMEIAEVKRILDLIDVESKVGRGNLHAIFLKYISAEEAAKSLNALLDKSLGKDAANCPPSISAERSSTAA